VIHYSSLRGKRVLIGGASRGIGKAIAVRLAGQGACVAILGKSVQEDLRLGGTVYSAAAEAEAAGGEAIAIPCDIREESQIADAVAKTVERFGGIDAVINNASAIHLAPTEATPSKRFDLMFGINVRGTFLVTQHVLPHLKTAGGGHIITLSPPVDMHPEWFGQHPAYTTSKYAMSMLTIGWGAELKSANIGAASLWPRTTIDTAAVRNLLGGEALAAKSRTPAIVADAAVALLAREPLDIAGHCFLDEEVLRGEGVKDFDHYSVVEGARLQSDLFVR